MAAFIIQAGLNGLSVGRVAIGSESPTMGVNGTGQFNTAKARGTRAHFRVIDGSLHVRSTDPMLPIWLEASQVPTRWTRLEVGRALWIGSCVLVARSADAPGAASDAGEIALPKVERTKREEPQDMHLTRQIDIRRYRRSNAHFGSSANFDNLAAGAGAGARSGSVAAGAAHSAPVAAASAPSEARAVSIPSVSVVVQQQQRLLALLKRTPKVIALAAMLSVLLCGFGAHALSLAAPSMASDAPRVEYALAASASAPAPSPTVAPAPAPTTQEREPTVARKSSEGPVTKGPVTKRAGAKVSIRAPATLPATERGVAEAIFAGDYAGANSACKALAASHPDKGRYSIMAHVLASKAAKASSPNNTTPNVQIVTVP